MEVGITTECCMQKPVQTFITSESGTTAIEYGLIMGLVFLAIVGSVTALGNNIQTMLYDNIAAAF